MIKYKTDRFSNILIDPVEVERETANTVWIKGYRHSKNSMWYKYFDTWEDAHAFLLNKADEVIQFARRELERAQGAYGNIKGMIKPM